MDLASQPSFRKASTEKLNQIDHHCADCTYTITIMESYVSSSLICRSSLSFKRQKQNRVSKRPTKRIHQEQVGLLDAHGIPVSGTPACKGKDPRHSSLPSNSLRACQVYRMKTPCTSKFQPTSPGPSGRPEVPRLVPPSPAGLPCSRGSCQLRCPTRCTGWMGSSKIRAPLAQQTVMCPTMVSRKRKHSTEIAPLLTTTVYNMASDGAWLLIYNGFSVDGTIPKRLLIWTPI